MHMCLRTSVKGDYKEVLAAFDRELFEALAPPLIKINLIRFDGSRRGDIVHLKLKIFGLFSQEWIVKITDEYESKEKVYFTDEGRKLPPMLKSWEHNHIVEKDGKNSIIVDDIYFKTPNRVMDFLMYPALYLQFLYRKPVYKRYFRGKFG